MLKGISTDDVPSGVLGEHARRLFGIKRAYRELKSALNKGEHLYAHCLGSSGGDVYLCVDEADIFFALMVPYSTMSDYSSVEVWAVPDDIHRRMGRL